MFVNKLCLNESKTEFIVFAQDRHTKHMPECTLQIRGERIEPFKTVKNHGVILDSKLAFREHISHIVKACMFHIRRAWYICRYLDEDTAKRLMLAAVISRLD